MPVLQNMATRSVHFDKFDHFIDYSNANFLVAEKERRILRLVEERHRKLMALERDIQEMRDYCVETALQVRPKWSNY